MPDKFNKQCKIILRTIIIIYSLSLAACTNGHKVASSEALINAGVRTLNILKNRPDIETFNPQLKNAAGIAIFPSIYKAGFFVGAEAGNGFLIAKDANGRWGYPAFYTLASGSWGMQFGGQKSGVIFIIRSQRAVEALVKHQAKLSADVGIAIAHVGTGLEGSITSNLAADIVAYSDSKGLYGGVSLEGSAIIRRNDLNSEYYGGQVKPEAILIQHAHQNVQANILRRTLDE
jgi:lipid-binding SYLF domain-containing protein